MKKVYITVILTCLVILGGFILCLAQGVIDAQSAANQGGYAQQDEYLPAFLNEEECDSLDDKPCDQDKNKGKDLFLCGLFRIQGKIQMFPGAAAANSAFLFIPQGLHAALAADAAHMKRADFQRFNRIIGGIPAADTFVCHRMFPFD